MDTQAIVNYNVVLNVSAMINKIISTDFDMLGIEFNDIVKYDYKAAALEYLDGMSIEEVEEFLDNYDEEKVKTLSSDNIRDTMTLVIEVDGFELFCDDRGIEVEPEAALEWWAVSDWLAERLREEGEIIFKSLGLVVWGRTTSGQAIYLDSVIKHIADEETL